MSEKPAMNFLILAPEKNIANDESNTNAAQIRKKLVRFARAKTLLNRSSEFFHTYTGGLKVQDGCVAAQSSIAKMTRLPLITAQISSVSKPKIELLFFDVFVLSLDEVSADMTCSCFWSIPFSIEYAK